MAQFSGLTSQVSKDPPLPIFFLEISGGEDWIVFEEDEDLLLDRLLRELLLRGHCIQWKEVVPHHPRVRQMRRRGNQIGDECRGPAARVDQYHLLMRR